MGCVSFKSQRVIEPLPNAPVLQPEDPPHTQSQHNPIADPQYVYAAHPNN